MTAAIKNEHIHELTDLRRKVNRSSNIVSAAGLGLRAIGDFLGADGCEHCIDEKQREGLANAVVALGELLYLNGIELYSFTEEKEQ
ncbi:hypothetical protein D9M68_841050 [compost metagenome]